MDLIKSGRYIDIFLCQNMRNKNKHRGGVSYHACNAFLAHLSQRLIGELIVQAGIRLSSSSTFSIDLSSEAMKPILNIFHI